MEKVQNGFRGVVKSLLFVVGVFLFLSVSVVGALVMRLLFFQEKQKRRFYSLNTYYFVRFFLPFLRVQVLKKNWQPHAQALLIGNHMGYLDVLSLITIQPSVFVTSVEMKETPLLGWLTDFGGCIYVERRNRSGILNELKNMALQIEQGFNVVLYPEATSSNGEGVLPFKKTLPMAAAYAKAPIQPFVVNFISINGERFSLRNRDTVCWYGDMSFATSFWRLACAQSVVIEFDFLQPFSVDESMDRTALADRLYQMISQRFQSCS